MDLKFSNNDFFLILLKLVTWSLRRLIKLKHTDITYRYFLVYVKRGSQ